MDFESQSLRRTMSTPQYYTMDELMELPAQEYYEDLSFAPKMDRSHSLCYMEADLLATPQCPTNSRPRKSYSTPHVLGYDETDDIGLLTPSSTSSSSCNISAPLGRSYSHGGGYQNYMPFMTPSTPISQPPPQSLSSSSSHNLHPPAVKLEFETPKSVAMHHSISDVGPMSTPSTGVNPFYSPPAYLTATPQQQQQQVLSQPTPLSQPRRESLPCSPTEIFPTSPDDESKTQAQIAADFALRAAVMSSSPPQHQQHQQHQQLAPPPPQPQLTAHHHTVNYQTPTRVRRPGPGRPPKSVDAKPHKCQLCSKSFRRLEHLKRHSKIHTEERPFQCDVTGCHRRFSRSDNLRAHRRTHMKKGGRNSYVDGLE